MSKDTDITDLLGDEKPAKKTKKAPAAVEAAPAKKGKKAAPEAAAPAKKTKAKAEEAPAARVRKPVVFEDGEREELAAKVKKAVRKPISSKDLAAKLEVPTRKLRAVLYSMQRQELVTLTLEASRAAGMTVSPA